MKKTISPALMALIDETVKSCDVELYDVEFKGRFLRVWITSPDGITLDVCAKVSSKLSQLLDMENLITERYFLEVSSPGIERKLRNHKDFQSTVGQNVSISTRTGNFKGKVLAVDEVGVTIRNIKGSSGKSDTEQKIQYCDINYTRIIVSDEELFVSKAKTQANTNRIEETKLIKCENNE